MDIDVYIGLVYKNLKGEITTEEFTLLNDTTIGDAKLAATRLDIEATWDTLEDELTQATQNKSSLDQAKSDALADRIIKGNRANSENNRKIKVEKQSSGIKSSRDKQAKIFKFSRIASGIAAVFILGLCATFLLKQKSSIYDTAGQYTLADNSVVTLREGSTLRVGKFDKGNRSVKLEGEAYFEIAKDASRPFNVVSKNVKIQVLGTSFLVKELGANTYIDLVEGKIKTLDTRTLNTEILTAGMQVQHTPEGKIKHIDTFDNLSSWKAGTYTYKNQSLSQVLIELNLIFETEIITTDPTINDCTISGIFIGETLNQILSRIASQFEMEVKQDGKKWILAGGKCN